MVTPGPELEFRKQNGGGSSSGTRYPRTRSSGYGCLETMNIGIIVAQMSIIAIHFAGKKFEERPFSPACGTTNKQLPPKGSCFATFTAFLGCWNFYAFGEGKWDDFCKNAHFPLSDKAKSKVGTLPKIRSISILDGFSNFPLKRRDFVLGLIFGNCVTSGMNCSKIVVLLVKMSFELLQINID